MNRYLRYTIYGMLGILTLMGALLGWAYTHRDDMKQYALAEINKQLKTNIKVRSIRMDVFRHFPSASLNFDSVWVEDAQQSKTALLEAERISLGFNIFQLLRKEYIIREIHLSNGRIYAQTDKNGKHNYQIFVTSSDTSSTILKLSKVTCKQMTTVYRNAQSKQHYELLLDDAVLSITSTNDIFDMDLNGQMYVQQVFAAQTNWLKEKRVQLQTHIQYNSKEQVFKTNTPTLRIGNLQLSANLSYQIKPKSDFIDLQFAAERSDITGLLSLLPFKTDFEKEWKGTGLLKLDGTVKGDIGANQTPTVALKFDVDNGGLAQRKGDIALKQISAKGTYSNQQGKHDLNISPCSFQTEYSQFSGQLAVVGSQDPRVTADFELQADAKDLMQWLKQDLLKNAKGNLTGNLQVDATLSQLQKPATLTGQGIKGAFEWQLQQVKLPVYNQTIEQLSGSAKIGKQIQLNNVRMQAAGMQMQVSGMVEQFSAWMVNNANLMLRLQVETDKLVITDWGLADSPEQELDKANNASLPVHAEIGVKAAQLEYEKIKAQDVQLQISLANNQTNIGIQSMRVFGGQVSGTTSIIETPSGHTMQHELQCSKVQLKTMFEQCNEFNQQELTSKHLSGVISGNISMNANWDKQWNCDLRSIVSLIDLNVKEGSIIDYKPLLNLSRFAAVDDLKNLRFEELTNTIIIKNNLITIPAMEIKNNALNLMLSGNQSFSGNLDYRFRIKISELLRKKRNKPLNEFEEEDESGKGMYLYLLMTGTTDNPQISYDKSGTGKKVKQDLKAEKETIKEVLRKEFGIEKSKAIKEKQNNNDELEFEIE